MIRQRIIAGALVLVGGFVMAQPAQADVVIGPRFSYYFDNSNLRTSDLDGLQDARQFVDEALTSDLREASGSDDLTVTVQDNGSASNSDQVGFAMYGGMINFGDDRDRFTFTAMYGSGNATTELVSSRSVMIEVADIGFNEISVIQTVVEDNIDRIDAEASWQRRLNENFAVSGGLRYERLDITGAGQINIQDTDEVRLFVAETLGQDVPTRNLDGVRQPARIITNRTLETYSARIGATAFVPFNDNAVAFFNGMLHGSHQPGSDFGTQFIGRDGEVVRTENRRDSAEFSLGPDLAVGVQFILNDSLAIDVRYRAMLFFPVSGDFDFSDARANHGVNLGLSLRL